MKSVSLNFVEHSGSVQACNGADLAVPLRDTEASSAYIFQRRIHTTKYI